MLAKFHFGEEVVRTVDAFHRWHRTYRRATVDELPPDEEYATWRDKIMAAIGKTLQ